EAIQIATDDTPWYGVLAGLGLGYRPLDDDQRDYARPKRRRLLQLDDSGLPEQLRLGKYDIVGCRYIVTEAPFATDNDVKAYRKHKLDDDQGLQEGNVLPFNLLAEYSQGVKRLAVLRMDVDDLGDLFGAKLNRTSGAGSATGVAALAYTAALSAALSRFFEGWVGELCRQVNRQGSANGAVYAVYSGGDDLFLVGSWHVMPGLAHQIRDDFAAYVLGRPLRENESPPITLSAGITLHSGGYPLYQAADDAAEALAAAKSFARVGGHTKDAVSFLGRTLGWERFSEAMRLCDELFTLVDQQGAPRALLMTIQSLDAKARAGQRRGRDGSSQFAYGPWIWQGAYQLTRMAERGRESFGPAIEQLREQIVGGEGVRTRYIEIAGLAARWAQLLIRERSNRSNKGEQDGSAE
ncbi:MAG: type III-A CRISPR-associated protein Cas10/Csm1, partial [Oscillochloris sp.]|nr:type III-A CRISPR-associated protein Cas10/Csm1 [Oscillochloris sp.]